MTQQTQDAWIDRLGKKVDALLKRPLKRRTLVKGSMVLGAVTAASIEKSRAFSQLTGISAADFFRKHYKEMTDEDKAKIFKKLAEKIELERHVKVNVVDPQPLDGVHFAYCLNLSLCNGNRKCVEACVKENNQSRDNPQIQYIKVIEMEAGQLNFMKGDGYYTGEVPKKDKFYLPTQCNQCDNPPCVKVCPVEATWKEKDGIVVIDSDWCIGCRYCMAGCPYEARSFNFGTPQIESKEINPHQGYLSNRVRPKGVVEKCHFCLHRVREGKNPACMEACPTGARVFGNLNDPSSEVARILRTKRVFVLKEELNTVPQFYYYFD